MADQGSPREASRERVTDQLDEGRPGTIADRYEVVRTLGQGGMGAVYQARDTRLDRPVAIKTIRPEYLASRLASQRFFREARALARLNHPNILTLYDYGQAGTLHYLVMELGGQDLQHLLESQGGPLPWEQVRQLARGVCRALEYAHSRGVVHRDLKPANILVGEVADTADQAPGPISAAAVKVMDFGLAKVQGASAVTAPLARIGTPQYMSPEQAVGREADERSDLYALGVVLYELCTGVRPFDGEDPQAILAQHLNLEPVPPSVFNAAVPQALEALVVRLLDKDPIRRPASAGEVLEALEAIGGGTQQAAPPVAAASPSPLGRLPARTPLVGRVDELGFLKAQFDSVAAGGGGRLILVTGEPGVGKTRLARELGLYARLRGGVFLEGHYLRDGTPPYGPWVEALGAGLRTLKEEDLAQVVGPHGPELARVFPELVERLGPFAPSPALAPEDQRRRLFDGIAALVGNLARRAPLVLLLDDLQWAPGLSLLAHLARRLGESRTLLVGTHREQEFKEQPVLMREWAELNRARLLSQLTLTPLPEEQTGELVAHYFGEGPAAQLRGPVYRQTRGNAFFVEEVLRSLAETGAVRPSTTGWAVADPGRVSIPESMKLAVEERVTRLGEIARDVLVQASVLGQEFSFPVLRVLTGLAEDDLFDVIERAVTARLLIDRSVASEERYAFADDQLQEVLYSGISTPRRRRYHLRAGQALETIYSDRLNAHLEELARHFAEGNHPEKGADYAYRAGLKNDRLFNWARSLPLYRTALALWEQAGGHLKERAAACEKLGDVIYKSSIDLPLLSQYLELALALYGQLGNRRKIAILHYQIARHHLIGGILATTDLEKALEHLHRARTILEEDPDSVSLGLVYAELAFVYSFLLRWPECIAWARRATELGERRKRPVIVADACPPLGLGLSCTGEIAQGVTTLERGWRLATQHKLAFQTDYNRWVGMMVSRFLKTPRSGLALAARPPDHRSVNSVLLSPPYLAALYALTGDFGEASRVVKEVQDWLEGLGQPPHGFFPGELGLVLFRRGDWAQARALLEAGLEWAIGSHHQFSVAEAANQLGNLLLGAGEYARAEHHLYQSLQLYEQAEDILHQLDVLPCLCRLSVRVGHLDDARAQLAKAQLLLTDFQDWGGLPAGVALAEGLVRAAEGRWGEAESAFQRAVAVNQQYDLRWDEAKVYYEWASALFRQENVRTDKHRWEQSSELLSRALALWEPMGARPWVAQTHYASATLLLGRNQPGDRERALELLESVFAIAQEVGLPSLTEQALALKVQAQGMGSAERERGFDKYPGGLTAREMDVLRLIAAGRTNKEIAIELVVSVPTVERHTTNIYTKIGARGRADAIAYALRHGLI